MNVSEASDLKKGVLVIVFLGAAFGIAQFSGWATNGGQKLYLLTSFAVVLFVYVYGVGSWWGFLSANELKESYPNWSAETSSKPDPIGEATNSEKKGNLDSKNQNVTGADETADPTTGNK